MRSDDANKENRMTEVPAEPKDGANEKKLRVLQVNKMYYPATGRRGAPGAADRGRSE